MSRRSELTRLLVPLLLSAGLSGCADYLNHYDTVTLAAGNTQKTNLLLQHKDPFNPDAVETRIPTDG
jgi:outer membrane PBP1 activator LpoA protein